jgi:hypothetical protein
MGIIAGLITFKNFSVHFSTDQLNLCIIKTCKDSAVLDYWIKQIRIC